jgi:ABC-type phosphate transport system permease subunit
MFGTHVQKVNVVAVFIALSICAWVAVFCDEVPEELESGVQPVRASAVVAAIPPNVITAWRLESMVTFLVERAADYSAE